jgi:hypothetical protein
VTELVEHGSHPELICREVAKHADVTGTVDVCTESMLALSLTLVKVATGQNVPDV